MIELSRHIKALLLKNDCVIIPDLGGFIAHNSPAIYERVSNTFLAPVRNIGFNPQLTINDGVLVQSYMEAYNTDFPDAMRRIEKTVEYIKKVLYTDGRIELNDIGTIYYNVNGTYEFEPFRNAFFSPTLYGLDNFKFPRLKKAEEQRPASTPFESHPVVPSIHHSHPNHTYKNVMHFVFKNTVAVAAAVMLFLIMSVQVENTYVDDANYASIGSIGIFHSIKDYSAATMDLSRNIFHETDFELEKRPSSVTKEQVIPVADKRQKTQVKPVSIRTEIVAAKQSVGATTAKGTPSAAKTEKSTPKKVEKKEAAPDRKIAQGTAKATTIEKQQGNTKKYYIIISSLPNRQSAEKQLKKFKEAGCKDALIVESDGRFRIAYNKYSDKKQAYMDINLLKQQEEFKSAWVYSMK